MRDGQLLSDLVCLFLDETFFILEGHTITEKNFLKLQFSLIVNYSKRIPAEMGMDTQNYSCKSCRKHIGMVVFPFR